MRKRRFWLILIAAAMLLAALGIRTTPVTEWDYSFCALEKARDMQQLYDRGDEGWEVAGVFKDWHGKQCVLLKRKR